MASDFNSKVYEIVAQIPAGFVASYSQIAFYLGAPMAARAVGAAMRKAPSGLGLPCHRVVSKSGVLAPNHVFGDVTMQRDMLFAEGVIFKRDGRIDMEKSAWKR